MVADLRVPVRSLTVVSSFHSTNAGTRERAVAMARGFLRVGERYDLPFFVISWTWWSFILYLVHRISRCDIWYDHGMKTAPLPLSTWPQQRLHHLASTPAAPGRASRKAAQIFPEFILLVPSPSITASWSGQDFCVKPDVLPVHELWVCDSSYLEAFSTRYIVNCGHGHWSASEEEVTSLRQNWVVGSKKDDLFLVVESVVWTLNSRQWFGWLEGHMAGKTPARYAQMFSFKISGKTWTGATSQ